MEIKQYTLEHQWVIEEITKKIFAIVLRPMKAKIQHIQFMRYSESREIYSCVCAQLFKVLLKKKKKRLNPKLAEENNKD